ncbi:guanine deaminase [Neolentinus lepideus HHB14362 ss-1]|uniref:Guanine deaminase n=1 Tax=Neolentinus lepideus HHB14362 ss-1 TaxID=1314782 RepID=A0A165W761_9AGAM|nr:guanine deaminase [Neolentinus lepideus HHB14362 ss-1]
MLCLPFFRRSSGSHTHSRKHVQEETLPPSYSAVADSPPKTTIFYGRIVHSKSLSKLEILSEAALGVGSHGNIVFLDADVASAQAAQKKYASQGFENATVVVLGNFQFLFPGLIDCHFHAPQWPNNALGMEWPLREWVVHMTDPIEASYSDTSKAERVYSALVPKLLENGTTTVAYNSTIHVPATKILMDQCLKFGQRALIGKLCINHRVTAGNGEGSVEEGLSHSREVVEYAKKIDPEGRLVRGCIQPRGATYVEHEYLRGLGELSRNNGGDIIPVQLHMSEAIPDVEYMKKMYPSAPCYAAVYDAAGLMHSRTVVAHAIHLTPMDISILAASGAGVAHNPTSNTCLTDGECMVRELLEHGVKVGLGTDCSAGYSPSIIEGMRQASNVSRHRSMHFDNDKLKLSLEEIIYLGTMGGARVVGLGDKIGNFEVGKEFDALVVDTGLDDNVNVEGFEGNGRALVAKWVFLGDDRSIRKVFVRGRLVAGKDLKESPNRPVEKI